jgi:hypothetical protein
MISDIVYDGSQYDNYETLWDAIYEAARKINREKKTEVKNMFARYNKRLIDVIKDKGEQIKY